MLAVPMVADRLCRHPVWPVTLAFLARAEVDVLNPINGSLTSEPHSIPSGTGDQVAADFDATSLVRWLERRRSK